MQITGLEIYGIGTGARTLTVFAILFRRGAAAVFTQKGYSQIMENIHYYKQNAKIMMDTLDELGIWYTGGKEFALYMAKVPQWHVLLGVF